MFHEIDGALRQLLIREIPIRNGEVDVVFDQPTREWASRLSRPTLNTRVERRPDHVCLQHHRHVHDCGHGDEQCEY